MKPVVCPQCSCKRFDLLQFHSMMVICPDYALFTLICPQCGEKVNAICAIPDELRETIDAEAARMGAGMGVSL